MERQSITKISRRLINAASKCACTNSNLLYLRKCRKDRAQYFFQFRSNIVFSYRIYRCCCYSYPLHECVRFIHNSSLTCSSSSSLTSSTSSSEEELLSAITSCVTTTEFNASRTSKQNNNNADDDDKHELPQDWTEVRETSAQSMMFDKEVEVPNLRSKEEQEIVKWCEHAEKMLQNEESDYDGYMTMTIRKCKDVILTESSNEHQIANALNLLDEECKEVERLVGHRVRRPMSEMTLLRQKLERERAKLKEANNPFKRMVQSKSNYMININVKGDEELKMRYDKSNLEEENKNDESNHWLESYERYLTDMSNVDRSNLHHEAKENEENYCNNKSTINHNSNGNNHDDDDDDDDDDAAIGIDRNEDVNNKAEGKHSSSSDDNYKDEILSEDCSIEPDKDTIIVTIADLNHVRFLRSIALRRLGQFELAEKISFDVLRSDCYHVDVIKSLLEMYLGFENYNRVNMLLLFLQHEFEKESLEKKSMHTEHTTLLTNKDTSSEHSVSDSAIDSKYNKDEDITNTCASFTVKEESNENETSNENSEKAESMVAGEHTTTAKTAEHAEVEIVESLFRPLDIALQLLAAQIVNAISRQVCLHGEGRASRSIVHILTELARNMNRSLMSCLIEAIFRTNEEHQFRLKYEEVEIPGDVTMSIDDYYKKSKQILQTTIISILKGLLLPQMLYFVNEPVRFRCMLLSNLHLALREADRTQESFRAAEQYMSYYKEQKLLLPSKSTSEARQQQQESFQRSCIRQELQEKCDEKNVMHHGEEENNIIELSQENNREEQEEQEQKKCKMESKTLQEKEIDFNSDFASSSNKVTEKGKTELHDKYSVSSTENVNICKVTNSESYDIVADQEEVYKETLFTYLHDYILSLPSQGRKKCLEAIDEFPHAAEPWILLSLVLHKEDARANLDDAIVAVRHAMNLEPTNLRAIMVLANYYKACKRYALYREMMKRYATLEDLLMRGSSEREIINTITELQALPDVITAEHEAEEIKEADRALNETYAQMERSMAYSVPIDKDKRTFAPTQLASPMMQQEINVDRPSYMNEPIPTK